MQASIVSSQIIILGSTKLKNALSPSQHLPPGLSCFFHQAVVEV